MTYRSWPCYPVIEQIYKKRSWRYLLNLSLQNEINHSFSLAKIYFHRKMKKLFNYKMWTVLIKIRLYILCSLILINTVHKVFLHHHQYGKLSDCFFMVSAWSGKRATTLQSHSSKFITQEQVSTLGLFIGQYFCAVVVPRWLRWIEKDKYMHID